jgi:hypothetical protein
VYLKARPPYESVLLGEASDHYTLGGPDGIAATGAGTERKGCGRVAVNLGGDMLDLIRRLTAMEPWPDG